MARIGMLIAAVVLAPFIQALGPQSLSEEVALARAIVTLEPNAAEWSYREPDSMRPRLRDIDRAVVVDIAPGFWSGRIAEHSSFYCERGSEDQRWICYPASRRTRIAVAAPPGVEGSAALCPWPATGIVVSGGVSEPAVADLVDFVRGPSGEAALEDNACWERAWQLAPRPACEVTSINKEPDGRFDVRVRARDSSWIRLRVVRECAGVACNVEVVDCSGVIA